MQFFRVSLSHVAAGGMLAASALAGLNGPAGLATRAGQPSTPQPLPGLAVRVAGGVHTGSALPAAAGRSLAALVRPAPAMAARGRHAGPSTLLDELGHLGRAVPPGQVTAWRSMLHQGLLRGDTAAWRHVWIGEVALARDEQPEAAIGHFREARRLADALSTKGHEGTRTGSTRARAALAVHPDSCSFGSLRGETNAGSAARCAGVAAYDTALALYYAGAYEESAAAFRHLRTARAGLTGFEGARSLFWYRRAAAAAGYHAAHARLGIPEPRRLDHLCAVAGLAVCLRGLGRPYDRATVAAACPHTGEGSTAGDILAACRKLGVSGRLVKADDRGLRLLPKPLVAFVEGDHFAAVVRADAKGVSYLCSDCGRWPGGRVDLTWRQWHALQPGTYIAVTRLGSRTDRVLAVLPDRPGGQPAPLRLASASLAHLHLWGAPQLSTLVTMLKGHVFLASGTTTPGAMQCGFRPLSIRPGPFVCPPKDGPPTRGGAAAHDPVDLATGEEEYRPDADIRVFNPHGPQIAFSRIYDSLRNPDDSYNWSDFGMGWSTNYNMVVKDPSAVTRLQLVPGAMAGVDMDSSHAPSTPVWDVVQGGTVMGSDQMTHNWAVSLDPNTTQLDITVPSDAPTVGGYEARFKSGSTYYSAHFDVTGATQIPQGTTLTIPSLGTHQPTSPGWDIILTQNQQTLTVAKSTEPNGWTVDVVDTTRLTISAPLSAATSTGGAYEVQVDESAGGYRSGTFDVTVSRTQYSGGAKTIVFPNGATTTATALAAPTAQNPAVQCSVPSGEPLVVWWYYDGPNYPSGHFEISFHNGTTWVMTDAGKLTTSAAYAQVAAIVDPRINDNSSPPKPIPLLFAYNGVGASGFPLLQSIQDGSTHNALLTIHHAGDSYCEIDHVDDAYGRSVYYMSQTYLNPGVPSSSGWAFYLELTEATPISQPGLNNPPWRWQYGYTPHPNGVSGESVNMLTSITVPSPAVQGQLSTAMIEYDDSTSDGLTGTVTDTIDANGYKRAYLSYNGAVMQQPPAQAAGSNTRVTVTNTHTADPPALVYTVTCNGNLDLTGVYDSSATQVYEAEYGDSSNPDRPTAVTVGSTSDGSARTTTLDWCDYGNLMRATPPKGANSATFYTWSESPAFPMGLLTAVQQGSKPPTQIAYYPATGLPETITAPAPWGTAGDVGFVTTSFFFSNLGNLTELDQPGNNAAPTLKTLLNYTSDPGDATHGVPAYSQTEVVGEPLTVTDGAGKVTHLRFNQRADTTTVYDALGYRTDFLPTLADQLQRVTYPATGQTGGGNASTLINYDLYPGGPPTSVLQYDESGRQVRAVALNYGNEGELLSRMGDTETAVYQYTPTYQLSILQDGNGHQTAYQHNDAGYLTSIKSQNGDTIMLGPYTKAGDLTQRVDARNVTTTYAHADPDGLLTGISYSDSTPSVSIQYDQYDRRSQMTDGAGVTTYLFGNLDELHAVTTTYTGLPQRQISYNYRPDGSRLTMQTTAGQYVYRYDLAQRLNSLTNPYSEASTWGYLDNGWLQTQTLGNGITTTYTLNARGFLTDLQSAPSGQSAVSDFSSILSDALGNRLSMQASVPGATGFSGALTYAYAYQGVNGSKDQLTGEQSTRTPAYNFPYTPDPAGNLQAIRGLAGLMYDGDNQIDNLSTVHYDFAGNPTTYPAPGSQTAVLAFDAENRLTSWTPQQSGAPVSFGYNGDGLRVWKQVGTNPSSRVYYLYDGSQPVVELDSTGTVLKAANTFGANGLLSRNVGGTSSGSTFYTFDPQGSVCQRYGPTANLLSTDEYDAFGLLQNTTQTGAADVYGFGAQWGYQSDAETGLLLLTNRYYDPGLGRFLTRDPIGSAGGLNLYAYVGNGPLSFADPLGLFGPSDVAYLVFNRYTAGAVGAVCGLAIAGPAGAVALGGAFYGLGTYGETGDAGQAVDGGVAAAAAIATLGEAAQLGATSLSYSRTPYPTSWDFITPAEEEYYPGTQLPRSFSIISPSGNLYFVKRNATKHIGDFAMSMIRRDASDSAVGLAIQVHLESLRGAIGEAEQAGITYGRGSVFGGWELSFGPPQQPGHYPEIFHALPQ